MGIDMSECARGPVDSFSSFAEFFTRRIDLARRPLAADERACLSPVDGKVLRPRGPGARGVVPVKGTTLSLVGLLGDARSRPHLRGRIARRVPPGPRRLPPRALPRRGHAGPGRLVPGRYHAGGPYARGWLVPVFAENVRVLTAFDSDHFGRMQIVEVGALTVGSIRQSYRPGARVERGAHKGWFELGGSTVVLLFPPGAIALDPDLVESSARGAGDARAHGGAAGTGRGA